MKKCLLVTLLTAAFALSACPQHSKKENDQSAHNAASEATSVVPASASEVGASEVAPASSAVASEAAPVSAASSAK